MCQPVKYEHRRRPALSPPHAPSIGLEISIRDGICGSVSKYPAGDSQVWVSYVSTKRKDCGCHAEPF
jgi:hypothetical protein